MSKIEITKNLIASLPKPENKGYILCDSWYSCKAIFNSSEKADYSFIGALKTNGVIYPKGHERLEIKLNKFTTTLNIEDFDLVTVKDNDYYIYNYVGNLKDRENVTIYKSAKKDLQKSKIIYIYESAASGTPIDKIFELLKIT